MALQASARQWAGQGRTAWKGSRGPRPGFQGTWLRAHAGSGSVSAAGSSRPPARHRYSGVKSETYVGDKDKHIEALL